VLVENYENYTRTPAAIRVLRPVLGEGLLIAEGPRLETSAPNIGARVYATRGGCRWLPHMVAVTDETIAKLAAKCGEPVDLRENHAADDARDRRAHHVLVRHGASWADVAHLHDGIRRPAGAGRIFSICCCR